MSARLRPIRNLEPGLSATLHSVSGPFPCFSPRASSPRLMQPDVSTVGEMPGSNGASPTPASSCRHSSSAKTTPCLSNRTKSAPHRLSALYPLPLCWHTSKAAASLIRRHNPNWLKSVLIVQLVATRSGLLGKAEPNLRSGLFLSVVFCRRILLVYKPASIFTCKTSPPCLGLVLAKAAPSTSG